MQYVANLIDIPTLAPEAGSVTGVSETELTLAFLFVIIVLISIFSDIITVITPQTNVDIYDGVQTLQLKLRNIN